MTSIKFPSTNLVECVFSDLIAEKNPEFAALLKQYKDAGGQF